MSSTGSLPGIPNQAQPFVGIGGIITRPWFLFLQGRAGVQTATVIDFAGPASDAPVGYLVCGQAVSRTQYYQLFSIIGTTYGPGDGSTTFDLPPQSGSFLKLIKT